MEELGLRRRPKICTTCWEYAKSKRTDDNEMPVIALELPDGTIITGKNQN